MRAILEFDLTKENEAFETARNAFKYRVALYEMHQYLVKLTKRGTEEEQHICSNLREYLDNVITQYKIRL